MKQLVLHCSNASNKYRQNGKQYKETFDFHTGRGCIVRVHLDLRESFDVRNRKRVCLLEVIMKATLLILAEKSDFKT